MWPGIEEYEYFKRNFPKFKPQDLSKKCDKMDPLALDLLSQLMALVPTDRISVKEALEHVSLHFSDKTALFR